MKKYLTILWWCKIWGLHDWTSASQKNKKPTKKQLKNGMEGEKWMG